MTLARGDGLPVDQIIVGALPAWLTDETAPGARAIAEVAVRRELFEGHPLGFIEPPDRDRPLDPWPYVQAAAGAHAGDIALVLRAADFGPDDAVGAARSARAAALVSAEVARATVPGPLRGIALDHARGMVAAAVETLDRMADQGWRHGRGGSARLAVTPAARGRHRADRELRPVRDAPRAPRLTREPRSTRRRRSRS